MDPYDILPYESIAFPETHPGHLAVLGRLFGLDTPDPGSCRVLELGCASGGNLIPMAWHLPGAHFVGIDLSRSQIDEGLALTRRLELANIDLRQGDILALEEDLGEFDYIIAHGVYSWVPAEVRAHLLGLAGRLLAPEGLFYVSYNTLPGWRMRGMLRDILLYASREADSPSAKLRAAEAALTRLGTAVDKMGALSGRYLKEEIASLRDAHPSYLLFEYLAEHNQAFLFTDFMADSERHGLRYLCDTELRTLFPSTYGDEIERSLADIDDGIELEQWLDFVTNRNFRQSLLCRADAALEDEIDLDRFATLTFAADLRPARKPDLRRVRPAPFVAANGTTLDVSHPLTKALLLGLAAHYPDCLPLDEVMPEAAAQVAGAGGGALATEVNECLAELFSLFAHRAIIARTGPLRLRRSRGAQACASRLARAQVEAGQQRIATIHHGNLDLDAFAARLITRLDGSLAEDRVVEQLVADLQSGDLMPPKGVQPRTWTRERLLERTRSATSDLIALFTRHGVLEAEIRVE
jgi:methyltransferase-like protein/ubiquinone/menaquinone biosynthesis C-methylase UbiE